MMPNPPLKTTGGTAAGTTAPPPPNAPARLLEPAAIRVTAGPGWVYPALLILSTAMAALFCVMYITQPVMLTISPPSVPSTSPARTVPTAPKAPAKPAPDTPGSASAGAGLLPNGDRLPGEPGFPPAGAKPATSAPHRMLPSPPTGSPYEETNLRIQHILNAEGPGGFLARLDLDVPVLYQSRNLRWTPEDVAQARDLVGRLINYQEKTSLLRAEGADLLAGWNHLMDRSLPVKELRADSPSLPSNQEDAGGTSRPAVLPNAESIKIQPAGK